MTTCYCCHFCYCCTPIRVHCQNDLRNTLRVLYLQIRFRDDVFTISFILPLRPFCILYSNLSHMIIILYYVTTIIINNNIIAAVKYCNCTTTSEQTIINNSKLYSSNYHYRSDVYYYFMILENVPISTFLSSFQDQIIIKLLLKSYNWESKRTKLSHYFIHSYVAP